jgi:hypothetical protein
MEIENTNKKPRPWASGGTGQARASISGRQPTHMPFATWRKRSCSSAAAIADLRAEGAQIDQEAEGVAVALGFGGHFGALDSGIMYLPNTVES